MNFFIGSVLAAIVALEAGPASASPLGAASTETRPAYRIEIILRITQVQRLSGIPAPSRVAERPPAEPADVAGPRVRRLDPINQTVIDVVKATHRIGMALLRIWLDQWTGATAGHRVAREHERVEPDHPGAGRSLGAPVGPAPRTAQPPQR